MLDGIFNSLGLNRPQEQMPLSEDVSRPSQLAELIGGPGVFTDDVDNIFLPSGDVFQDVGHMVSDIQELLRAPDATPVRPTDTAPMPSFGLPEPEGLSPEETPFRPQPVKVQPYCISKDPESDPLLGDGSPGGGPVSGRTVLLLLLQRMRQAKGVMTDAMNERGLVTDDVQGDSLQLEAGPAEGSLGRLMELMRNHDYPLREVLDVQEQFDRATLDRDALIEILRQGRSRGVPREALESMQKEAAAVLKADQGPVGGADPEATASDNKDARLKKAAEKVGGMTDLLFDLARLQMRVSLAGAQNIRV